MIEHQAIVWRHSRATGTTRLMLLAIADHLNRQNRAWPSVATLAAMCRVSSRQANKLLAQLRALGEVEVIESAGPRGVNVYRLLLAARPAVPTTASAGDCQWVSCATSLPCHSGQGSPVLQSAEPLSCATAEAPVKHHMKRQEKHHRGVEPSARAVMSRANLVATGVEAGAAASLLEVLALKGRRFLLADELQAFLVEVQATGKSVGEVVDYLVETGSYLPGFRAHHLAPWGQQARPPEHSAMPPATDGANRHSMGRATGLDALALMAR